MSVDDDDNIADFKEASLKKFCLNDVSPGNVAIRNHEEIEVDRPVKELLTTGSENSIKNPLVLCHTDLENVAQGI